MKGYKKRIRMFLILAGAFWAICQYAPPALASETSSVTYDENRKGSITVQLDDIGTERSGVKIDCYRIASPNIVLGNFEGWKYEADFEKSGVTLDRMSEASYHRQAADLLTSYINSEKITPEMSGVTDKNGALAFSSVPQGIYLLVQSDAAAYGNVLSFCIAVPYRVDGAGLIYDVKTETKGERFQQTEPEPDAGGNPGNSVTSGAGGISAPKTGDETPVGIYAALAAASFLIMLLCFCFVFFVYR